MMMDLTEKLNQIFCEVFDQDDLRVDETMTAHDVDGWDSLSHVNLILAIEGRFKIRFTQKELLTMKNVGDLLRSIRDKTGA
jgi:acyl carrier protein